MPSMVRLMYQLKKCVEIKGDYVEKKQSCFISVTLKSWSVRKLWTLLRNCRDTKLWDVNNTRKLTIDWFNIVLFLYFYVHNKSFVDTCSIVSLCTSLYNYL